MKKFRSILPLATLIFFTFYLPLVCAKADATVRSVEEKLASKIVVDKKGNFSEEMQYTTRITSQWGVDNDSNHEYTYRPYRESLKIIDAHTVTPDGKKIPVKREWIKFTSDVSKDGRNFDPKNKVTIVFPEVSVGSRLYSRTLTKEFAKSNKKRFSKLFLLSPDYVFEDISVEFRAPKSLKLKVNSNDFSGGLIKESGNFVYYHFHANQLTARKRDEGEIDLFDYAPRLLFTHYSDYTDVGRQYENGAAPKTRVTPIVKLLAANISDKEESRIGKIRALHDWVSKNIRYVSTTLSDGGFVPRDVEYILRHRFGDCKDYVVVLGSLLKAIGIESSPALINQGASYTLLSGPAVSKPLNHLILYIPSEDLFLDPTNQYAAFGVLNDQLLDKPVVLTSLKRLSRTPRMLSDDNRVESVSEMVLFEDGRVEGTNNSIFSGTTEIDMRYDFAVKQNESIDKIVGDLLYRFNEVGTGAIKYTAPTDTATRFRWSSSFTLFQVTDTQKRDAFILPVGISPGFIGVKSTYLPSKRHDMPYVCYSNSAIEEIRLQLPNSIEIEQIPNDVLFEKKNVFYQSTYQMTGNSLYVKREYRASRSSMVCNSADFENWLEVLDVIRADFRSKVIFAPKNH